MIINNENKFILIFLFSSILFKFYNYIFHYHLFINYLIITNFEKLFIFFIYNFL